MIAMLPTLIRTLGAVVLITSCAPRCAGADAFDHSHARYGQVLSNFVVNARVDYAGLKAAPAQLDEYLQQIASVSSADFARWPRDERLALLLNLYNAQTLKLIADHHPLKSIRDIGILPGAAWRQPVVRFGGRVLSLDHLEHQIIRAEYDEPRIHFAVVCAAVSCPPLRAEPYVASRLAEQLDDQARRFLAATDKNQFDAATGILWLSAIFDWYEADFTKPAGSLVNYVKPFLPADTVAALAGSKKVEVKFLDYDWSLNEWQR